MAADKKSFIAYCDWEGTFQELPDEMAGKLVKHLFAYVNDRDPETDDALIKALFASMKNTLKRDLEKYQTIVERNRENGSKGGRPKKNPDIPKKPTGLISKPKKADNESVTDREINSINTIYEEKDFLKDWNELRASHLKKPSYLNKLTGESKDDFNELAKNYSRKEMRSALIGLFKQRKLPNDQTSMQSNPGHFLKFFNSYLTAYHDQNHSLYGKEKEVL